MVAGYRFLCGGQGQGRALAGVRGGDQGHGAGRVAGTDTRSAVRGPARPRGRLWAGLAPRASLRRPPREDVVVYQVRADLQDTKPPIWRRLELRSDLTLEVVHQVLQDAFGWTDSHLHRFALGGGAWDRDAELFLCPYDVADPDNDEDGTPEQEVRLDEVLTEAADRLSYVYDYGDNWAVTLRLEKVLDHRPDSPAAACRGGRMAAPPDDSRGEYLHGGLAAVVDDPEHFEAAEVNEALGRPWFTLTARGFHPRLLKLANTLSFRDDDAGLGERLASLPELVVPDDEKLARSLGAYLWFLDAAAEDGIPLTAAGWMRPAVVKQAARQIPQMAGWIGKANREDLTHPVMAFRESLIRQLRLLRKYKGALRLTKAGAAVRGKPAALFDHLAARLAPGTGAGVFAVEANLLVLAHAAISPGSDLPLDRIAADLAYMGYEHSDGSPLRGYQFRHYDNTAITVLANVDQPPAGRRERERISPVAATLAHAALLQHTR
ncbi:plasmid pRiA4b ORF-3 family protein [Myceligenerans sp. TRM 65318]|uniref:Plasmid pRiA4b ORF-3 family protein n=1 Tax=Myceligenerans pegani TaxID=2776917 RepID=A0ABR9N483_9MICO|nr:plasmid pRiA4b ORF-3 family protein [Myceligenerans sp. TRM 65318]MBE3020749.1 plasmid pRiA4b ORF-3 family protein [Myceligenerans sp. TRM 65318]